MYICMCSKNLQGSCSFLAFGWPHPGKPPHGHRGDRLGLLWHAAGNTQKIHREMKGWIVKWGSWGSWGFFWRIWAVSCLQIHWICLNMIWIWLNFRMLLVAIVFFLKWSCLCCCLSFAQEKVEHLSSAFVISLVLEIFHKRLASKAGLKRSWTIKTFHDPFFFLFF